MFYPNRCNVSVVDEVNSGANNDRRLLCLMGVERRMFDFSVNRLFTYIYRGVEVTPYQVLWFQLKIVLRGFPEACRYPLKRHAAVWIGANSITSFGSN